MPSPNHSRSETTRQGDEDPDVPVVPEDYNPVRRSTTARTAARRERARSKRLTPSTGRKLHRLFLVRESDRNSFSEFAKMVRLVLTPHSGEESVDRMLAEGSSVMDRTPAGEARRLRLGAEAVEASNGTLVGYLFISEDGATGFFYALASASETNLGGTNNFCDAFANTILEHRPARITTGPPDRLIRVRSHAVTIKNAAINTAAVIECVGSPPLDMGDTNDQFLWDIEGWRAEGAYRSTVARLTNGDLDVVMAGLWPKAPQHAPFGYVPDSTSRSGMAFDPDRFDALWKMIELAARPPSELDDDDVAITLGRDYGVHSPVKAARDKTASKRNCASDGPWHDPDTSASDDSDVEVVTLDQLREPGAALRSRCAHLETYRTGFYRYYRRVLVVPEALRVDVAAALTDRNGNRLPDDNYHPNGDVQVEPFLIKDLHLGPVRRRLQDGTIQEGWSDAELSVIDEAIRQRGPSTPTPSNHCNKEERRPFTDLGGWVEGDLDFKVTGEKNDLYTLRSRPKDDAFDANGLRRGWKKHPEHEGQLVARFGAELHVDFATQVIQALESAGIEPESVTDTPNFDIIHRQWERRLELKKAEVEEQQVQLRGARRLLAKAAGEKDHSEEKVQKTLIKVIEGDLEEAIRQRADLRAEEPREAGEHDIEVDVGGLRALLAELLEAGPNTGSRAVPRIPNPLARLLKQTLLDFRVRLSDTQMALEWTAELRVRTSTGYETVGPVNGSVRRCGYKESDSSASSSKPAKRPIVEQRKKELVRAHLEDGGSLTDTAAVVGWTDTNNTAKKIREQLKQTVPSKGLRAAIVDCPVPEARRVLWAVHNAEDPTKLEGIDPGYARRVAEAYTEADLYWTMAWAADTHHLQRLAIDYVKDAADPQRGVRYGDLMAALELDPTDPHDRRLVTALSTWTASQGRAPDIAPCLARVPYRDRQGNESTEWTRWTAPADKRMRLRWCDRCEDFSATHVLRVPELPQSILCPQCRQTPGDLASTYPEAYLELWVGPRGSGSGRDRSRTGTHVAPTPTVFVRNGGPGYHGGGRKI